MDCDNTSTDVRAKYIWMNGGIIPWQRAQVHVFAHALHFGTSVFEGLRAYDIGGRPFLFRGPEHFERLLSSCRMARLPSPLTVDQWIQATADLVHANGHRSAYVRPLVFRGGHALTLDGRRGPVETALATVPMETYLGSDGLTQGVDVQVSSWRRPGSGTSAPLAKIGGQYVNNQAVAMEAHDNGFAEGIALDTQGYVSEGSGENVFVVYKNEIFTPCLGSNILSGITRSSVTIIARHLGYTVTEASIPRDMLYSADELFLTGTAAEVCPVRSVDRIPVGSGARGPVTRAVQETFFGIVQGTHTDLWKWLQPL